MLWNEPGVKVETTLYNELKVSIHVIHALCHHQAFPLTCGCVCICSTTYPCISMPLLTRCLRTYPPHTLVFVAHMSWTDPDHATLIHWTERPPQPSCARARQCIPVQNSKPPQCHAHTIREMVHVEKPSRTCASYDRKT